MATAMQGDARPKTYSDKLRDPRWQKMRLQVLSRDHFTCLFCRDKTATLHVHHCFYRSDFEPSDYPVSSLLTLCEQCHQAETDGGPYHKSLVFDQLATRELTGSDIDCLSACIFALPSEVRRDRLYPALRTAIASLEDTEPNHG